MIDNKTKYQRVRLHRQTNRKYYRLVLNNIFGAYGRSQVEAHHERS